MPLSYFRDLLHFEHRREIEEIHLLKYRIAKVTLLRTKDITIVKDFGWMGGPKKHLLL